MDGRSRLLSRRSPHPAAHLYGAGLIAAGLRCSAGQTGLQELGLAGVQVERGERRVLRGGSWNNNGRNVRSACRNNWEPDNRNDNAGFRLARARRGAGGRPLDQTGIPSVPAHGKKQTAAGMLVGRADASRRLAGGPPSSSLKCLSG